MPEWLQIFSLVVSTTISVITLLTLLCKPFRDKITGRAKDNKDRRETDRCLLRSHIIQTYYRYEKEKEIPEYEYENLAIMYKQYKNLGGNSFVDKVWDEVQKWHVYQ